MSAGPLFSEHWHRVRDLRPSLAADVVSELHSYRGSNTYVLQRRSGGKLYRLDARSHALVMRLDGTRSVTDIWEESLARFGESAPGQPELMALLAELHAAGLIVVDQRLDAEYLFSRGDEERRSTRRRRWMNPLFMTFPLVDPDPWLERCRPLAERLFSRRLAAAWLALVVVALCAVLPHGSALRQAIADADLLAPRELLLLALCWVVMKAVHEFAHALALKRYGCEVREMGIALMVLLPIPYVNASAAGILPDKRQRMVINAAGIVAELAIAAVAALVWLNVSGVVADLALRLMLIGGLSTLLFNANPLLRFDGYYLLADWLEIPELESRGKRHTLAMLRRLVFGETNAAASGSASSAARDAPEPLDARESAWLIGHCLSATVYRIMLMFGIALFLSKRYFFLGKVLAIWVLFALIVLPFWRYATFIRSEVRETRYRPLWRSVALGVPLLLCFMLVPLPASRTVTGVVWLPENAILRAASDCEVTRVVATPGGEVRRGSEILRCENEELDTERLSLLARLAEVEARIAAAGLDDALATERLRAERALLEERLRRVEAEVADQVLVAAYDGQFVVDPDAALAGRFFRQGAEAAVILPKHERVVRAALPERHVRELDDDRFRSVALRLASDPEGHTWSSSVRRLSPVASRTAVSAALTRKGGGRLENQGGGTDRELREAAFDVELDWPEGIAAAPVGSHVSVRIERRAETLLQRSLLALQRLLLGEVQGR
ncbi:MAG: hypothetical protein CSB44_13035 [Gammaproteobacteria bacterium]|nr:MAG: hypothetical protein CSB44_13035 [Gammaproteobacteria bacterium]